MTDKDVTASLPWKTRLFLNLVAFVMDITRGSNGTINRYLLNLLLYFSKTAPQSSNTIQVSDVMVDSTRNLWFRQFVPKPVHADSKVPLLIFFHGGGFCFFSPDLKQYDHLCCLFAEKLQAVVLSINYRLTPEHKFPAQYDDGFDVFKFLDQGEPGIDFSAAADLSRCYLVGDSAGGNIAHHVALRYAESAETTFTELKLAGLIALQPFFGGEERTKSEIQLTNVPIVSVEHTDWYWKAFLPKGEDRSHEAVNVFGPKSSDLSGLKRFPDTLVVLGGLDPLRDWQTQYYKGLKKSGISARLVEYGNAVHAFYLFPELTETSLLEADISDFIGDKDVSIHDRLFRRDTTRLGCINFSLLREEFG